MKLPYDDTNPKDIERYAKTLIGKNFQNVLEEYVASPHFVDDDIVNATNISDPGEEYTVDKEKWLTNKINKFNNPRNKGTLGNLIEEFFSFINRIAIQMLIFQRLKLS